jgi:hypothetical protein
LYTIFNYDFLKKSSSPDEHYLMHRHALQAEAEDAEPLEAVSSWALATTVLEAAHRAAHQIMCVLLSYTKDSAHPPAFWAWWAHRYERQPRFKGQATFMAQVLGGFGNANI